MLGKPIWNTLVQIAGKAVSVVMSLIITGVLTRKLAVDSYGNFILITSTFVFLDALADFGTKIIGVREIAGGKRELVKGIFWLRTVMAVVATILGLGLIWGWSGFGELRTEATLALLMVGLTSLAGFLEIVWQARLKMEKKVIVDLIFPLLFLVWLMNVTNIGLITVFGVYIVARIISLIWGYWWVKSDWSFNKYLTVNGSLVKEAFKVTWPMGVYMIAFASYDRLIDSMMIKSFLGAKEVAWYGLGYKIYRVLVQPAYFLVNSIFPILSGKSEGKKRLFWEAAGVLLVGAILSLIGVIIMAPWMVNVLGGESFEPTVGVLRILAIAVVFSYLGHLVGFSLISKGGQKEMLKLAGAGLIFNVVMNLSIIPYYGIKGAAWVTVGNEFLGLIMMTWFLRKATK